MTYSTGCFRTYYIHCALSTVQALASVNVANDALERAAVYIVLSVSQFPEHSVVNILPARERKMPPRGCCNRLVCGQQNIRRG